MSNSSNDGTSIASSGCPVKHGQSSNTPDISQSSAGGWASFFQRTNNTNTNANTNANTNINTPSSSGGGCPMKTIGDATPASIEAAAKHAQTPQPDQQIPLSTHRVTSSIPKPSDGTNLSSSNNKNSSSNINTNSTPAHQPSQASKWVYPSEQQFFNAMKRKGWEIPPGMESAIPHVVHIHNAVNERGWREVLKWENERGNDTPRLVKFIGRPKDLSPRARFYSMLWLRNEPFDRHDWIVDRGDGSGERRYVIDFYNGKEDLKNQGDGTGNDNGTGTGNGLPSMYLDVRPALDDLDSAQDRVTMFWKDAFPGIAGLMNSKGGHGSASADSAR